MQFKNAPSPAPEPEATEGPDQAFGFVDRRDWFAGLAMQALLSDETMRITLLGAVAREDGGSQAASVVGRVCVAAAAMAYSLTGYLDDTAGDADDEEAGTDG